MENKLVVKKRIFNSRFFLAPINTGLAHLGNPTNDLISFHELRSNNYTGISYVGNTAIDASCVTNKSTLYINPRMLGYSNLAKAIQEKGSIPGIQIACFKSKVKSQRAWKNFYPHLYTKLIRQEIKSLTNKQIGEVIISFQKAIKTLKDLGFVAIQLHAAHGYFLNNFLSRSFNCRNDDFGRDRSLIIKEILGGIDCSSIIIDLRVSLFENHFSTSLNENDLNFLELLYSIPNIDIISLSNGIYNIDKRIIYPSKKVGENFMINVMEDFVLSHKKKIWNISGNIRNLALLNNDVVNNLTYSIARPIIADPHFIEKSLRGNIKEINVCKYLNRCHYYSLDRGFIECGVNKNLF